MSRGHWEVPGHNVTENAGGQMGGWGHFEGKTKQWFKTALCPNAWHPEGWYWFIFPITTCRGLTVCSQMSNPDAQDLQMGLCLEVGPLKSG